MTKEEYDKIVEPVAPFEEIEKKPKKPMTIAEFVEDASGRELSERDKKFVTAKYEFYKNNPNGILVGRGSAKFDTETWFIIVFDMYNEYMRNLTKEKTHELESKDKEND